MRDAGRRRNRLRIRFQLRTSGWTRLPKSLSSSNLQGVRATLAVYAASLLIEGFKELDATIAQSVDFDLKVAVVLEDIRSGSLRVFLRTILSDIDDQALKDGEYKKAIGPVLVRAKTLAVKALDKNKEDASQAINELRSNLNALVAETDIKHIPAYAPIHQGRLVSSLDILQNAKRTLGPQDRLAIETEGKIYQVDLTQTWEPSNIVPVAGTTETESEGVVILTIRRPDLLGEGKWQFAHGTSVVYAAIKDENWVARLHAGKVALHSGDALRCKVKFTYVFDDKGRMIEQKTEIVKVLKLLMGPGHQTSLFDD
jgi:hypothetical protein